MAFDRDDRRPPTAPTDPAELAAAMAQPVKFAHTPELGELAAALAAAQGQMDNAARSAQNPGRKRADGTSSRYADLAAARDAWRGPLSENGLALVQMPAACGGRMVLVTMLVHGKSGQWLRGDYPIDAPMADPQRIGSAVTYARRYAGMAVTGLAPEDDDGNAASDAARREPQRRSAPPAPRGAPPAPPGARAAWKQFIASRVQEANDEWANELKTRGVPEARRGELTNPGRCMNAIVSKWVEEGILDEARVCKDDDPKTRDAAKVQAAIASDFEHDPTMLGKDIATYIEGRRARALAELESPAGK